MVLSIVFVFSMIPAAFAAQTSDEPTVALNSAMEGVSIVVPQDVTTVEIPIVIDLGADWSQDFLGVDFVVFHSSGLDTTLTLNNINERGRYIYDNNGFFLPSSIYPTTATWSFIGSFSNDSILIGLINLPPDLSNPNNIPSPVGGNLVVGTLFFTYTGNEPQEVTIRNFSTSWIIGLTATPPSGRVVNDDLVFSITRASGDPVVCDCDCVDCDDCDEGNCDDCDCGTVGNPVVTSIEVTSQPLLIAFDTQTLDLGRRTGKELGLAVSLGYSDGSSKTVWFAQFAANGITTNPAQGTVLSLDDDGTIVEVSCNGLSAFTSPISVFPPAKIIVDDVVVTEGTDYVDVDVYIEDNPGFGYFEFAITTSPKLKFSDVTFSTAFSTTQINVNYEMNTFAGGAVASVVQASSGLLVTLQFEIVGDWNGTEEVSLALKNGSPSNFSCPDYDVLVNFTAGSVTVEEVGDCDHDWSEWEVTTPATYYDEGVETRVCSICGETETRILAILDFMLGDIDGDSYITLFDLVFLRQYIDGVRQFDDRQMRAADVDSRDSVNLFDLIILSQYIDGVITAFPSGG